MILNVKLYKNKNYKIKHFKRHKQTPGGIKIPKTMSKKQRVWGHTRKIAVSKGVYKPLLIYKYKNVLGGGESG